jgi:hypothetical protein
MTSPPLLARALSLLLARLPRFEEEDLWGADGPTERCEQLAEDDSAALSSVERSVFHAARALWTGNLLNLDDPLILAVDFPLCEPLVTLTLAAGHGDASVETWIASASARQRARSS